MDNIEIFNRIVVATFKDLYENFPRPMLILTSKIRSQVEISNEDWWEQMKQNPVSSALIWLRDEQFIRYADQTSGSQFIDVVLTSKGFAALNKSPEALSTQPTIGDRVKEYSKTCTKEAVGAIVKMAFHAMSSP